MLIGGPWLICGGEYQKQLSFGNQWLSRSSLAELAGELVGPLWRGREQWRRAIRTSSHLAAHHAQHHQLAGAEAVGQGNDGALVVAEQDAEHVDAGVDCRHLDAVAHSPQSDRSVSRPGDHQLAVVRHSAAPHLRTTCHTHRYVSR